MSSVCSARPSEHAALRRLLAAARAPRLRTMREFAEQEIILPTGPYAGERFRVRRQPVAGLILDAIDSGDYPRIALTGPSQSGKSLIGFGLPAVYHLCEIGETVILGVPDLDMARDKWMQDILPVIEASRYRDLLPRSGAGSRGGTVTSVTLRNGATLRFMTGGGGDKSRAGFTARVVIITEVDGMDEAGGGSREADKVAQIEARTNAFGPRRRIYLECTVSYDTGRIWQEYQNGTASRIYAPCPHCDTWVAPDREHLVGWDDAPNVIEAKERAALRCPSCSAIWTEDERGEAHQAARLVHKGQDISDDGEITGSPTVTDTLGVRYSCANNLLVPLGEVGAKEFRKLAAIDEDNAERELRQFWWALPVVPGAVDVSGLQADDVHKRAGTYARGHIPEGATHLTVGIDVGKRLCHWVCVAWQPDGSPHIADYGRIETAWDIVGAEAAVLSALREFRDDYVRRGWPRADEPMCPEAVWIDSQYLTDTVHAFCLESGDAWLAVQGTGTLEMAARRYSAPRQTGASIRAIGDGFHVVRLKRPSRLLVQLDSDRWKSYVHERLTTPMGEVGAMTVYRAGAKDHLAFAKHLTSERQVEEITPKRGRIVRWENPTGRNNHWLDALAYACAASSFLGVRLSTTATASTSVDGVKVEEAPPAVEAVKPKGRGKDWFQWREHGRKR